MSRIVNFDYKFIKVLSSILFSENTHNCTKSEKCLNFNGGYECDCSGVNGSVCDAKTLILQPNFGQVTSQNSGSVGDSTKPSFSPVWILNLYSGKIQVHFTALAGLYF